MMFAQKSSSYDKLTDAQKNFITEYINATGSVLDSDGNELSQDELYKKAEGYEDFVDTLANNSAATSAIDNLFSLDKSKMTPAE